MTSFEPILQKPEPDPARGPSLLLAESDAALLALFAKPQMQMPPETVFLACAAAGPQHLSVRDAGERALARKATPWTAQPFRFLPDIERARALAARLIGASPDGVAVVSAVSSGMAVAAANLSIRPGQTIVVVDGQFSSNRLIWDRVAEEAGAALRVAHRDPETGSATEGLLAAIDARCAVVACDPLHWTDGARHDLAAVAEAARTVGAALVIDATQAAGVEPLDVAALDPDFMVFPTYKWLLGPYGQAFLYAAPRHRAGRPLEEPGPNRDADGAYLPGARRYDVGEKTQYQLTPMTIAGLELALAAGPERVQRLLRPISDQLADVFARRGFKVTPAVHRSAQIFLARPPADASVQALAAALEARSIYVTVRDGGLRVAPHLWVDTADIDRVASALDAVLAETGV